MKVLEELLAKNMGLDAGSIGRAPIERAVRERMRTRSIGSLEEYARLVAHSFTEWQLLVNAVVVTETWFFRDSEPFLTLGRLAVQEWLSRRATGPLRLLSIPCASGEEPYSMAMALLEAGFPQDRFQIDALDISTQALAQASEGAYGPNSFRSRDLGFRDRYFKLSDGRYYISPLVRRHVHFRQANVFDLSRLADASYDHIFCRNLLIYLHEEGQRRAVREMHRLLRPSGVLFVAPAEMAVAIQHGFVSARLLLSCACRPRQAAGSDVPDLVAAASTPRQSAVPAQRPESGRSRLATARVLPAVNLDSETPLPAFPAPPRASLALARSLADAGNFAEAERICALCLDEQGASADAFYLLGLVRDAAGAEMQAGEFYRRALYLEPAHYESLLHLALLARKQGDNARAKRLLDRARRAQSPPPPQP